jgi:hypothetical protein
LQEEVEKSKMEKRPSDRDKGFFDKKEEKKQPSRVPSQIPMLELSLVELDNIFFPEEKEGQPPVSSTPRIPRISLEDATPIPLEKEPPQKTHIPSPGQQQKAQEVSFRPPKAPQPQMPPEAEARHVMPKPQPSASASSTAEVTSFFVPADRIDARGNIIPVEPPSEETDNGIGRGMRKKPGPLYTVILAFGRRIHFTKTIKLCSEFLGITKEEAERRIRFGKGVLFENVDAATARDLQKQFTNISQGVRIVRENALARVPEPQEVLVWLFSRRHFQVTTNHEKLVLPWDNIQLAVAGGVRLHERGHSHKKVLDLILSEPHIRLRAWDTTFNYRASGVPFDPLGEVNFLNLIKILVRFIKKAHFSPTLKEMIDLNLADPRHFEITEEFENYTRWLYLTFYGEPLRL